MRKKDIDKIAKAIGAIYVFLGLIALIIGLCAMDSEDLLVPVVLTLGGLITIIVGANLTNIEGRK